MEDTKEPSSSIAFSTRKHTEKKPCSVCGEEGDGAHFGADACCRACAAFFRRSVALQKKYVCRNGGQCPIEATIRCMCRACRYEKCLKVGMRKTAVQRHRDMLGKREEDSSKSEADCPNLEKGQVNEDVGMPTLSRLRENYSLMDNIRKVLHNREGDSVFAKREPRVLDYKEANEINKKEIGLVADFLINSFPDFASITADQKTLLYRNFFLSFIMLETGYFCALKNRTDIFFLSTGDYIDTNRPETFYIDKTGSQPMSTEDAVKIFAPSFNIYRRNLLEPMRLQRVDDIEFFALCSIVLWDHGLEGQTEECEVVSVRVRQRIVDELIFYYRHVKKYKEPADRLSTMLILLPPLQVSCFECLIKQLPEIRSTIPRSKVFKAYAVQDEFYEIINGRF